MIAVILIGGMGTRLRPLTCDTPKPLLPVVNRPFLEYQFDILKSHGVREIVLCTSYRPQDFRGLLGDGRRLGLRLSYIHEKEPLGTGGALKNAESFVKSSVIVLNGDVLNAVNVTEFLKFHRRKRAQVTIALTRVKDPTLYGLVETDETGRIKKFLEKPAWDDIRANTVNAGAYIFEPSVLGRIPQGINHSLERQLFPHLLQNQYRLYGFVTGGYWIDIGSIEKYHQVHVDLLRGTAPFAEGAMRRQRAGLWTGTGVRLGKDISVAAELGRIVLGEKSSVGDFARLTGPVCVGPGCIIGRGASLENCVVLEGTRIGEGAVLKGCVVGAGCRIGAHAVLSSKTALGGNSRVEPYSSL